MDETTNPATYGENTRAVHSPAPPVVSERPLGLPVYRSATFAFDTAQDYSDVLGDRAPGYTYSRIDNPTADAFGHALAAAEGSGVPGEVTGQAFSSGMAAVSTVLMTFARAGAHVVAPAAVYGGTYSLLSRVLPRFGVQASFVDMSDLVAVQAAIRPETVVVWAETLANPTMAVADLPGLAALASQAGALLVVDSTFASPAVCRPLAWGADLVVHSATKYIGGHSDVTGGAVAGRPDLMGPVRATRIDLGGALAPDDAFLLHRGLSTLPLRMERHCASALAFAEALEGHPRVQSVDYPGLPAHRDHALAGKLFEAGPEGTRYGAVVTVTPAGGRAAGMAMCDGLRLVAIATSLGGTHSVVSHVATTTHRQMDDAALRAAGIDPAAVRVSIGLEDVDDLVADVSQALQALG
ncbi:MAG: aminotransferase class I/II-fold pyridoxal phosphate-dependent enzyme [Actinomycetota bacterium]|nr:aminotransferase class I/II-fold pyridoxal phosphate-dependent enzyme [Actinomycetota bacterium]